MFKFKEDGIRTFSPVMQDVLLEPNDYYRFGASIGVPADVVTELLLSKNASLAREDLGKAIIEYSLKNNKIQSMGEAYSALTHLSDEKDVDTIMSIPEYFNASTDLVVTHSLPAPRKITVHVQKEIAKSLDELKRNFASLVMDIQDALRNEVKLDSLVCFLELYLEDTFKPPDPCRNIKDVFAGLEYCFINYEILQEIVDKFICNKATTFAIKDYGEELKKWLESTTVQKFKAAVEKAATPVSTDPSPNHCLVVLRLEDEWKAISIKNLKRLLKYIFRDKSSILTKISVDEGSVLIRMSAPRSEMLSLLTLASRKYKEMVFLGIISVQVGSLQIREQKSFAYPFTFELGLSAGIVYSCSPALVECLLKLGANPNAKNERGFSLLMIATKYKNANAVTLLLNHKADPHMFNPFKTLSPITYAAALGQLEVVKLLLKAGVSPDYGSNEMCTPLIGATLRKQYEMVRFLLQNGAYVDRQDMEGKTALFVACSYKHVPVSIAQLLLKAGANPNLKTNTLKTPFGVACLEGNVELVKLSLQFNADPNIECASEGDTPLMHACMYAHHNIVKLLLQSGAYVNSQNSDGSTALTIASIHDDSRIISILLHAKADVNVRMPRYGSPLLVLCSYGNNEMVERLLEAGADPNVVCTEYFNFTPLHFACAQNKEDIVQLLLNAKANTNVLNSKGFTPLSIAVSEGNVKIVEALLAAGADVELENDVIRGWRPIFFAAINGHLPILNLLLKHGASLKEDKFGITPQAVAASMGHVEAQRLLQSSIAKSTEKDVSGNNSTPELDVQTRNDITSYYKKDVSGNNSTPELDVQTRNSINSYYKKFRSDLSSTMESFQKTLSNMASFATNISQYV